ncbi:MAG: fibrobacter succinogenes major paralogous domain-containing protein [Bacteroidales bacterium]
MKTKITLWIPAIVFALSSLFLVTNCEKDDDVTTDPTIPVVSTNEVTEVTQTTATSGGSISSDDEATVTEQGVCWSTSQTPTIADNKTTEGTGAGSFTSAITGLTANTTYYVRAYATNSAGTGYGSEISFTTLEDNDDSGDDTGNIVFNPNITYGSMSDIDGNTYKTVTIGTQTWMAENLKVTQYNDGTSIPHVTDSIAWSELTTGALCDYDNIPLNSETYGKLYNWYAVNTGNLCPTGWHVPSDDEWTTFENHLIANGYNYDGTTTDDKIAKAMASSNGWKTSSAQGAIGNTDYPEKQNASGFTALPGGYRSSIGAFVGGNGIWWSATEDDAEDAWFRYMHYNDCNVRRGSNGSKEDGYSVRC